MKIFLSRIGNLSKSGKQKVFYTIFTTNEHEWISAIDFKWVIVTQQELSHSKSTRWLVNYERKSFRPNFIIQTIELIWSIWEKPIRPIRYQSTIVPPTTAKVTTWPFFINLEMRFFKCQIIIDLEWPMDYYIDYLKRLRIGSLVNSFISTEKLTLWLKYIYDQTDLWITIRPRETGRQNDEPLYYLKDWHLALGWLNNITVFVVELYKYITKYVV